MTDVGDYVILKTSVLKGRIGIVTEKYNYDYNNGLLTAYLVKDLEKGATFEYYRREFKQISKDKVMVELL